MKVSLAKNQLKDFGKFLEEYQQQLQQIESTFKNNNAYQNTLHFSETDKLKKKPITVNFQCSNSESLSQFKLVESDNKIFSKVVLTFYTLSNYLEEFNLKSEKYQKKFLKLDFDLGILQSSNKYKDADVDFLVENENVKIQASNSEEILIKISEYMNFLCKLKFFVSSGVEVAINLLQQLVSFHSFEKNHFGVGPQHNELFIILENFMINLVKFDEILSKSYIHIFWPPYKKTIIQKFQQPNQDENLYSESQKLGLMRILNELEIFLGGFIFQSFLENVYSIKDKNMSRLYTLTNSFNDYVKESLQQIKKYPLEICDESETVKLIGINVFIVLQHKFFGQVEQKIFKQLLEINLKFVGVNLIGKYTWHPEVFLKRHAETLLAGHTKYNQEQNRQRQIQLQKKVEQLPKLVKKYYIEVTMWIFKCKYFIAQGYSSMKIGQFKQLCILFLQGAQFAGQMNFILKSILNTCEELHLTISKQTISLACKMLVLIQIIQSQLSTDVEHISNIIKSIIHCLQYKCLHIVISTKKKISAKTLSDEIVDIFSALKIIEKSLNGPPTIQRLFTVNLLIQSSNLQNFMSVEEFEKLQKTLRRLKFLSRFQMNLSKICDLSYAVWTETLFDKCVMEIVNEESLPHFLNLICSIPMANKKYEMTNNDSIISDMICSLCGQVETFLRIEAHSGLELKKFNPFEPETLLDESLVELGNTFEDSRPVLNSSILNFNDMLICYKHNIENYLSGMFYNLTTINLNDWKAYEIMRNLAKHKLHLEPINDLLPNQSLEQGKDALEIMRNIHIFVSKYNYSMNHQYFVENYSRNKHLNTICIKHVANSLQTHGSGFINTAVNFSYQFLRSKFYTISQFLYDEQIHSRILKEYRHLMESKLENSTETLSLPRTGKTSNQSNENENQFIYKYEWAEELNKEIRALGMSPDGMYYMDIFRQLITEVGNTMGYIRLIRSGNVHAKYTESAFLPTAIEENNFTTICKENEMSEFVKLTAEVLDENLKHYIDKDEMDFFKLLTNAFKPFFRNPNNHHLKKFFLIVPALMINYVDYILNAREKITKRDNDGSITLFNDGFAMGLVCILKLLNQFSHFESLYWFKGIEIKFKDEHQAKLNEIQSEMRKNQKDNSLLQTLALVEKRMNAKFREFSLLRDSIYSAKIFFQ